MFKKVFVQVSIVGIYVEYRTGSTYDVKLYNAKNGFYWYTG